MDRIDAGRAEGQFGTRRGAETPSATAVVGALRAWEGLKRMERRPLAEDTDPLEQYARAGTGTPRCEGEVAAGSGARVWAGFDMRFNEIQALYLSEACGKELKAIAAIRRTANPAPESPKPPTEKPPAEKPPATARHHRPRRPKAPRSHRPRSRRPRNRRRHLTSRPGRSASPSSGSRRRLLDAGRSEGPSHPIRRTPRPLVLIRGCSVSISGTTVTTSAVITVGSFVDKERSRSLASRFLDGASETIAMAARVSTTLKNAEDASEMWWPGTRKSGDVRYVDGNSSVTVGRRGRPVVSSRTRRGRSMIAAP